MQNPTEEEIRVQLNDILTQVAKTQNIEDFEISLDTEANYGDGFVGQFYKGYVLNKDTRESISIAIKKAPIWDFDYNPIFKNEISFYRSAYRVLDHLQKEAGVSRPFNNLPKYFCGDLEPKKEYLAMEDLKQLGYVMYDKKQCFDKQHLEMLFNIYGKFHALSYILQKKDLEKFQSIIKEFTDLSKMIEVFLDKQLNTAVSAAVNALDTEKDKIVYDEIRDLGEHALTTWQKASKYNGKHSCLVHGDCWSNNMLFKYSESGKLLDIKLIDFQMCQNNTPVHDLSYLFYSGASKPDFDQLDNYLRIYHNSFLEFSRELNGNSYEIFSYEELKNEWKENAIWGVLMGIYLWQIKLTPKDDFTDIMEGSNNDEKGSPMESFNRMRVVMEKVYTTDLYRERTTDILRHAVEYGVINKNKIIRNK